MEAGICDLCGEDCMEEFSLCERCGDECKTWIEKTDTYIMKDGRIFYFSNGCYVLIS